jgi:glycosyltransferase involved in cell wall biosynthesis
VVSADLPSSHFLMRHEETGLLCPAGDGAAYAEALHRLLSRPAWRARLGAAARAASRAYSWDAAMASVAETYRDALKAHAAPATAKPRPGVPAFARGV